MAAAAVLPYPSSASGSGATIKYSAYHYSPQQTMSSRYVVKQPPLENSSSFPTMGSSSSPNSPSAGSPSHLEEPASAYSLQQNPAIQDTPRTYKSSARADFHSGSLRKAGDPELLAIWATEFRDHHACSELDVMEFIETYVPAKVGCPNLAEDLVDVFYGVSGGPEQKMYDPLIEGANRLGNFGLGKTILFGNTDLTKMPQVHQSQHATKPDISSTFPGEAIPEKWTYDNIGHVWEVKAKESEDPITAEGTCTTNVHSDERIAQLAKYGRNLLISHASCYSFVVGVYGKIMRIFRFDHASVISSQPFEYKQSPAIVHKFLWHLANPIHGIPHTVCGSDPTIRQPTAADIEKMYQAVVTHVPEVLSLYQESAEEKLKASLRWIDVYWDPSVLKLPEGISEVIEPGSQSSSEADPHTNEAAIKSKPKLVTVFAFGPGLYSSSGLFSRATQVLEVMFLEHPGTVYVLKDAWRQRCRHAEGVFYARIQSRIQKYMDKDETETGLATCIGSFDLGNTLRANDFGYITQSARVRHPDQNIEYPLERNRVRSLASAVGRRLSTYQSTKQLVYALRCAIRGHQLARKCGVLHRDISSGNILIYKTREGGFLHDFDYSSIMATEEDDIHSEELKNMSEELKEKTGTQQFMALGILYADTEPDQENPESWNISHSAHHDLESFYWVLTWILLRYSKHNHRHKNRACTKLFDPSDADAAYSNKAMWLSKERLKIKDNPPLNALLEALRLLFINHTITMENPDTPVAHESVLAAIDLALRAEDWPVNDAAVPFAPPPSEDAEKRKTQRRSESLRKKALRSASASSGSAKLVELAGTISIPSESGKRKRGQQLGASSVKSRKSSSGSRPRRKDEDEA